MSYTHENENAVVNIFEIDYNTPVSLVGDE